MIEHERDLFVRELEELYNIERRLEEVQASLSEEAVDEELGEFYAAHSEATRDQIGRLETVFDAVDADVDRRESATVDGLLGDRDDRHDDLAEPVLGSLVDAELGKAIERYEVTKIETLLSLAHRMDLGDEVTGPLAENRTEAENAIERLQELSRW